MPWDVVLVRYFYDTEFIEDGRTIDLISIGIVAEDGRKYYAVNSKIGVGKLYRKITGHDWLMANVVPLLPVVKPADPNPMVATALAMLAANVKSFRLDLTDPVVKPAWVIRNEVREFLRDDPELWAYYGAYDHVCLMQLFGPMVAKPEHLPMWTNDVQQLIHAARIKDAQLPAQMGHQHNALDDARWVRDVWNQLHGLGPL